MEVHRDSVRNAADQKKSWLTRASLALFVLLLMGALGGCGGRENSMLRRPDVSDPAEDSVSSDGSQPAAPETDFPGSYTVPEGWVKAEQHSTEDKVFYVEQGHENDELPDNISVEIGTNRYSEEEHVQFRDAIVRQLMAQLQGVDAELTGEGTNTEQEYVVYIFTVSNAGVITKQFYVVGDQRYCLVHLTNFTGSESADQAAWAIVNSFVWD